MHEPSATQPPKTEWPEVQGRFDRRTALKFTGGLLLAAAAGESAPAADAPRPTSLPYEEYAQHDALGLAALVREKKVKPEELLEAAIARAEAANPRINAIVGRLYEEAREAIKRGLPRGPFTGVPFVVKDISFYLAGVPCSRGSALFKDSRPAVDSTAVRRYRQAGLVILARTATPELAILPITESALHGITRNPWNLKRTAGGSSGGTAAAVAAGIVPMGSGGDGGGSIRIPASCCGLFGLKPTRARVPTGPNTFDTWEWHFVIHALTRSVRDSAALLDATSGAEAGDPCWAPPNSRPFLKETAASPGKLRIALVLKTPPVEEPHAECRKAAEDAAQLCEELGHHVEEVTERFVKTFPIVEFRQGIFIPGLADMAVSVEQRLAELGRELHESDLEPSTRSCFESVKKYTACDQARALRSLHESSRRMAEFQREFDIILSPTLAKPPVEHFGERLFETAANATKVDSDVLGRELIAFCPFTQVANCTGQPAMSVPLHWTSNDLPVGVQFIGRFGDEATLFRLAAQLEKARPWFDKRPRLSL